MSKLFNTTLRIDLSDPEGLKAWTYLVNRDKSRFRSYSDAIIAAVNGYFDREQRLTDDPYRVTRSKCPMISQCVFSQTCASAS